MVKAAPVTQADLDAVDAVVFGGSGDDSVLDPGAWQQTAIDALQRTIDARKPAWASCYGFQALSRALSKNDGVKARAAASLGLERNAFRYKLKKYGLLDR